MRPFYGERHAISQSQKCCRKKLVSLAGGKAQRLVGSEVASFAVLVFKEAFFGNVVGAAPVRRRGLVLPTTLLCGKIGV